MKNNLEESQIPNVGKPIDRRDSPEKVTGEARYSADWPVEGLLHGVAVGSSVAHGRVAGIDVGPARKSPGVKLVLTVMDAPRLPEMPVFGGKDPTAASAQSIGPLQSRDIVHENQYVAVVVADTFENALEAASLIQVDYEVQKPQTDYLEEGIPTETAIQFFGQKLTVTRGDANAALEKADVSIDELYSTPPNHHNPIEPHSTIAVWEPTADGRKKLTVYDASQGIVFLRITLANQFEIPQENVRVVCKFIGGAFGSKGAAWPHVALTTLAAREAGAPVKLSVLRKQMYGGIGHRSPTRQRVALGASSEGRLSAWIHEGRSAASKLDTFVEGFTLPSHHMYEAESRRYGQQYARLHTQNPTFMRAPGEVTGLYAIESAMDELAHKLAMDPIELRLRNEPKNDPTSGLPFSGRLLEDCLKKGAEAFGWSRRPLKPRQKKQGKWWIGSGVAAASFPVNLWPCSVRLTLHSEGRVVIESATHEMGTGTTTAQSQFAASLLGLPLEQVEMILGDTDFPPGALSGGSGTTASTGEAIKHGVDALKLELLTLCSSDSVLSGLDPEEACFQNGSLVNKDSGKGLRLGAILTASSRREVSVEGKCRPNYRDKKYSAHSFGAQFCEVGVDEELGLVRVRRMLSCFAAGRLLSEKTARSQFMGGMVMGVGQALLEATEWDHRHGRIVNNDLAVYMVPTNADVPEIEVLWIDEPDYNATLIGAKGIGEIGITGVAAAVANAVFHATGRRVRDLPITPEKLMAGD